MGKFFDKEFVKRASFEQLHKLCDDMRERIFTTVSECGGHLSSNLGAVELTVALYRVFDFPKDKIVFDVGHQCYPHKLLSGRGERFSTLRKEGGLSGFPKRSESEYDCYDTGHAGTSVSAALGIAKARDLKGEDFSVISFVGDGSFNNGLIYEAFNSLKILNTPILIVLNDNGMSIAPTVGGTHDILSEMDGSNGGKDVALFEQFGLQYLGLYDGNNVEESVRALTKAKELLKNGSVLLHVHTKKGFGYAFCENAPDVTHGVSPAKNVKEAEYSTALGEELSSLARKNGRIVAVTAAMTDSLGLRGFFEEFPDRSFDVGICEEHASVLCAAMATEGVKPYYAIYSTFLQRAYDEIVHDICGQNLPVTFCIDRAGITGADGETHQGVFDLSYLALIPNLTVAIPSCISEFRAMIKWSETFEKPLAIRYPRSGNAIERNVSPIQLGKFDVLHSSTSDVTIIAAGERPIAMVKNLLAKRQADGKDFTLINARFLKPLDEELLGSIPSKYVITVEDNVAIGGLGSAINRFYLNKGKVIRNFAYHDAFIPHGGINSLSAQFGVSEEEIDDYLGEIYARG